MALTDYDYLETRNEIIADAFEIVGVKEPHNSLTAFQIEQGVRSLQLMVKHWTNKHLFLWSNNLTSFPTVAAQLLYTTADLTGEDDAIIGLDRAWILDSSEDLPLEVITYNRYLDIPDKTTSSGRPTHIAYKPTASGPSFYLYPTPDAVYTIKTQVVYPLKDFDVANGNGDTPARFQQALLYGLADKLFDKYPDVMNAREKIEQKAEMYFIEARRADVPREDTSEVEPLFRSRCR